MAQFLPSLCQFLPSLLNLIFNHLFSIEQSTTPKFVIVPRAQPLTRLSLLCLLVVWSPSSFFTFLYIRINPSLPSSRVCVCLATTVAHLHLSYKLRFGLLVAKFVAEALPMDRLKRFRSRQFSIF
uniref:Uncharacterized protein n=1 Tax=Cucumis melo TaxID=3656 RepID=A0A9I9EHK2_CUCME